MRPGSTARRAIAALSAVVVLSAGFGAYGEPLQPEACDTLKAELSRLEGLGVGHDLRRGPEVGKRTLAPARLDQVERLLAVIEQIEFRCPRPPPAPTAAAKSAAPAGADGAAPASKAKVKPKPKPAAAAADPSEASEKNAAKPPPKRKAEDAFVPPADAALPAKAVPPRAVAKSPPAAAPAAKPGLEQ